MTVLVQCGSLVCSSLNTVCSMMVHVTSSVAQSCFFYSEILRSSFTQRYLGVVFFSGGNNQMHNMNGLIGRKIS